MITHQSRAISLVAALALAVTFGEAQGHMFTKAAPSGPRWTSTSTSWVDIKDMEMWFYQYEAGNSCIGFSSESGATSGARMFVRAVVDGATASPTDVVYASESPFYCRLFQFGANLSQGLHHVKMQVRVDAGGTAQFGDRTLSVVTAPTLVNIVAAPSGAYLTSTSNSWADISDMSLNINLPSAGTLALTFGAEVFNTTGASTFLRVLVDGATTSPSDVMIADEYVLSVHSMAFVSPYLSAGSHTVKVQWFLNGTGTAYMGDRTLSLATAGLATIGTSGGIASVSAASGPSVTTTSSGFSDMPGLTLDVVVPENATLAITVQGEGYVSAGRMFLCATVDGVTCSPSDATQTRDAGYRGTTSMTFVMKNVARGTRQIAAQWLIDPGETAYFGDRNITVMAFPCPGPDMTDGFQELRPAIGTYPVLVLLWDPQRPTDPAPTVGAVTNTIHGTYPSVADYFSTNSNTNFTISNAGILGWFTSDKPYTYYWSADDPTDADHDGFTSGHVRKWWEAVTKADASFNFAAFDVNGDGILDPQELGIVIVIPQNSAFGTVRVPASQQYPTWQPLVVDGVTIPYIAEVYAGSTPNMGAFIHELCHLLLNLPDLYFNFFVPYAAGPFSIMSACYWDAHLDPFHKIRLGWLQPTLIKQTGRYNIYPVESSCEAYILMDPAHGEKEYFIIENRQRSQHYDVLLPDSGLAVWHIIEDPAIYGTLPAPNGVSVSDWASIAANDWGRRSIQMVRPVIGPPADNGRALWDGADPASGYDLLSSDPNSAHSRLAWSDGTPSGFAMKNISTSSAVMAATFEVPASLTAVSGKAEIPDGFVLCQNYPNPFNPTTRIRYTIARVVAPSGSEGPATRVRLAVYDLLGREVAVLVDEVKQPGQYVVSFDASRLASGVYFYRLVAGAACETRRMLLLR